MFKKRLSKFNPEAPAAFESSVCLKRRTKNEIKSISKITLMVIVSVVIEQAGMRLFMPQPDIARADQIRSCTLVDNIQWNPVIGADVEFSYETAPDVWDNWVAADEDGFGGYKTSFQYLPYRWRVRILLPWHGDLPFGDVQTFYATDPVTFEWVVWEEE